jgi:hypothetical protein
VAGLLVLFALVVPNRIGHITPAAFLVIPIEVLVGAALLLALPDRARRVVAVLIGVALALLTLLKLLDMGFYDVLDRPFDPVDDWPLLGNFVGFLARSLGQPGTAAAVIGTLLVAAALPVAMAWAVLRLTRLGVGHRTASARTVGVLTMVWVVLAVFGVPVATHDAATLAYDRATLVGERLRDQREFAAQLAVDAFRDTPGDQLLTGLRGKDVIVAFVESYGRVAVADPELAQVAALLDTGTRRLQARGFAARSAFLTSSTAGGGSWLAHGTLLSGVWIDTNQRHDKLMASDRLTLNGAFQRAGWRTVGVMPAINITWPDASFYHYDQLYTMQNLGYRGPLFTFSSIPDQYTMAAFHRAERTPDHAPVMAEIALLSSHGPWAPLPRPIDWDRVGDGSAYAGMADIAGSPDDVLLDRTRAKAAYRQSIEYSLEILISYVEKYGDDNLVLVFLGDHQPVPLVTGEGASRDVPITLVARDRAVLDRISGWGWQDGLRPGPQAPVWRMDTFRDHFLTTFGPTAEPAASPPD